MKTTLGLCATAAVLFGAAPTPLNAALPANFPGVTVTTYVTNKVADGCIFLAVASETPGVGTYQMILQNDGTPVWYEENTNTHAIYDFKVLPNGHLHSAPFIEAHRWTDGGDVVHEIRDEGYHLREILAGGNGYVADGHDFQWLPNGHVLQLGYTLSEVDVSEFLAGGHPAARISGGIVQELDLQRNVVWQWRTWDHFNFADRVTSQSEVIDAFHLNGVQLDEDGQLIVGTPMELRKLDRQTGEILWTLGGPDNQFVPVGPGASVDHWAGHGAHRLENGNVLFYNHADSSETVSSKVHEYRLDEVAKTATLVWSYAPPALIPAWRNGNAQRLPNGNTLIGWGGAQPGTRIPACTEVTPDGQVVYELYFKAQSPPIESYRAFRFPWPPDQKLEHIDFELAAGNTYVFADTGVTLEVLVGGGGYNEMTVTREPYAPVDPTFAETAPRVLPVRVKLHQSAIPSMTARISFDAASFGFSQPTRLAVYYRAQAGQGIFLPQTTDFNPVTQQLRTTVQLTSSAGDFGEFIFGYPDVADVPYPPLLAEVENDRGVQTNEVVAPKLAMSGTVYPVNQELPVVLSWSPKGFARWYELQIAEEPSFANPVVAEPYLTSAFFVWGDAPPGTTYYYRVKTQNDGGASDWSAGAFETVAPRVQVAVPNSGENWLRGLDYFIQWQDNLAESVVIDLYKDGAFLRSLNTNSSAGAYQWEVDLDLVPGNDYSVRVRSSTDATVFDSSDLAFSIADTVPVTLASDPAGLVINVDGADYTAPAEFNWQPGSTHSLGAASPQSGPDPHTRYVFGAWSDGGAQNHSVTVPSSMTRYTATFSKQYQLDLAVTPEAAGTVSASPAGPWYDAGQPVSLTVQTDPGYRLLFWTGVVESQAGDTAQVAMSDYRNITATCATSDARPAPPITVHARNNPTPGHILLATWDRNTPRKYDNFLFVLDNQGHILKSLRVNGAPFDFQQQPNGQFSYAEGDFAGPAPTPTEVLTHHVLDADLSVIDSFQMKNGYQTDFHEFLLLPNGHAAMMSYTYLTYDMSSLVPGGKPNAQLVINILQEQDPEKNVVFEWRNIDHIPITDTDLNLTDGRINYSTLNGFELDNDGSYLASFRNHSEIMKISRSTGEVLWRWGSPRSEFTLVGEQEDNAPYYFARQHDIRRLPNGHVSLFDNGEFHSPPYSRAVEYRLDEANRTATLVSERRYPAGNIIAASAGSAQWMPDGGWFLCYGILHPLSPVKRQLVEYHADGTPALEIALPNNVIAYRARKLTGNPTPIIVSRSGWVEGQTVVFNDSDAVSGVALQIHSLEGAPDWGGVVKRESFAPLRPSFLGKAPRVLPLRVTLTGSPAATLGADILFDATSFGFANEDDRFGYVDPNALTVYRRSSEGGSAFVPLPTHYDSSAKQLRASITELGEFILGFPDAEEIPNPPILIAPEPGSTVNQELAVAFAWTSRGFARVSHLQIARDSDFTDRVVDEPSLTEYHYTWTSASFDTAYFYRVRITNEGGQSDWSAASFQTVPPGIRVTSPNGGESWRRGLKYFIRWEDNLADTVNIDLYQGGSFLREIVANTRTGAYEWEAGLDLVPGGDYSIRVSSATHSELFDDSDQPFRVVDAPLVDAASITRLADGRVQFGLTAPGSAQVTVWGTTTLSSASWEALGIVAITDGSGVFTDPSAPGSPWRFYRVSAP